MTIVPREIFQKLRELEDKGLLEDWTTYGDEFDYSGIEVQSATAWAAVEEGGSGVTEFE